MFKTLAVRYLNSFKYVPGLFHLNRIAKRYIKRWQTWKQSKVGRHDKLCPAKYKPDVTNTWLSTLEIGVTQFRSVMEIASKSPFMCENIIPIWYDFRGGTKAIQYSVTIASLICTTSPSLLKLYLHIPQQLLSSKRQNLWQRTTTTKKGENVLSK